MATPTTTQMPKYDFLQQSYERSQQITRNVNTQRAVKALKNGEYSNLSSYLSIINPQVNEALGKIVGNDPLFFLNAYHFSKTLPDPDLRDRCLQVCMGVLTQPSIDDPNGWACLESFTDIKMQDIAIQWFADALRGRFSVEQFDKVNSPLKEKVKLFFIGSIH